MPSAHNLPSNPTRSGAVPSAHSPSSRTDATTRRRRVGNSGIPAFDRATHAEAIDNIAAEVRAFKSSHPKVHHCFGHRKVLPTEARDYARYKTFAILLSASSAPSAIRKLGALLEHLENSTSPGAQKARFPGQWPQAILGIADALSTFRASLKRSDQSSLTATQREVLALCQIIQGEQQADASQHEQTKWIKTRLEDAQRLRNQSANSLQEASRQNARLSHLRAVTAHPRFMQAATSLWKNDNATNRTLRILLQEVLDYIHVGFMSARQRERFHCHLSAIKTSLYDGDMRSPKSRATSAMLIACTQHQVISLITGILPCLDFESRKTATAILSFLVRDEEPTAQELYPGHRRQNVSLLCQYYRDNSLYLPVGNTLRVMQYNHRYLREILSHDFTSTLCSDLIRRQDFCRSVDASETLRAMLSQQKDTNITAEFIYKNRQHLFDALNQLVLIHRHETTLPALRILIQIAYDRKNRNSLLFYLGNSQYIKPILLLLTDRSSKFKHAAFEVLALFVANPNKSPPIEKLLRLNAETIRAILSNFQTLQEPLFKSQETQEQLRTTIEELQKLSRSVE